MARDFLPRRDADLVTWSANFSSKISTEPAIYGLTAAQAAVYAARDAAFAAAHRAANDPSTNSRSATVAKNIARKALEAEVRRLAGIVRASPGVTPAMRVALGLCPHNGGGRSPRIAKPQEPPILRIENVEVRTVTFRLVDTKPDSGSRKRRSTATAAIYSFIGDEPPAGPEGWRYHFTTPRTVGQVTFDDPTLAPGTKVWLTARWMSPTGEAGPACAPMYAHLQYGVTKAGKQAA